MPSVTDHCLNHLHTLTQKHRLRTPVITERIQEAYVVRGGKRLVSFSCNDYLGLSRHPQVKQAAIEAIARYGAGAGASQLITGYSPLLEALEAAIASYKQAEAACIFGSGYLANIGTIPALVGEGDLILADKLSHACLLDGAKLSGAKLLRFAHNDLSHAKRLLMKHRPQYKHCLVLVDHVYSMDGDLAPMPALRALCDGFDAWLMADDAHGLGIIHEGMEYADIQMGTLSKAIGGYGAYVCGTKELIRYLRTTARSYIYSTALPPAALGAAIAALECIRTMPELAQKALNHARMFTRLMGLEDARSTIVPLIIGKEEDVLSLSKILEEEGFLVSAIRPPTVPEGTARLRLAFSALHRQEDIARLAALCQEHRNRVVNSPYYAATGEPEVSLALTRLSSSASRFREDS